MINIELLKKLSNLHIMIIEDDKILAYAIQQSLINHCKCVDVANDGLEGFEMFEKNKPDALIVDINLPRLNGLDMVCSIKKISPHIPVLVMTSYDSSENMLKSIEKGVYTYLRKPISIEDLQTALLMATKNLYNNKILLQNGYLYNSDYKQLIDSNKQEVVFTKIEQEIMHLLLCNINKIVDYSTIEHYVWKDKSMSLETLRMKIKKIRDKTYTDIIENISGCGYRINLPN